MSSYGEVLVVTDDFAERETVAAFGSLTMSCSNFINDLMGTLAGLQRDFVVVEFEH